LFALAWGERAVELLARGAAGEAAAPERIGALAVAGVEGAGEGAWRAWLSGRLTNAAELRERFGLAPDASDSAVLARLLARLGEQALAQLRGAFVAVALQRERPALTVARDQLGGRPLVHLRLGDGALFAEHEAAILELLPAAPRPDRLALAQWIERGSTPPRRTLFEGLARVPAGHRALLAPGELRIEPYWRPRYEGIVELRREAVVARLREAAFAAVGRAAAGAQRPAVRLSGGIDSACVAAALSSLAGGERRPLALGAVFPAHPETDERPLIEATAAHARLQLELTAFDERASILAPALEHLQRWRVPPVSPNLFVWRPLMAGARALGVDVMLDGEGGDELFGFAPHLIADELRAGRLPAAWRLTRLIPEVGAEADARMRLRALRVYGVRPLVPPALKRRRGAPVVRADSLLAAQDAAALHELELAARGPALAGPSWWRGLVEDLVDRDRTLDVAGQLRRESLDAGIERRHPFMFDLELLLTVLRNPPELQFDPRRDRALLRDALAGVVPEAVRTRHAKSFFTGLLAAGLALDGPLLAEGPARADAPVREFVRAEPLARLLARAGDPQDVRSARRVWHVGLADAWLRCLERPGYAAELRERTRRAG